MTKELLVVTEEKIQKWKIEETDLQLTPSFVTSLLEAVMLPAQNILRGPESFGWVSLAVGPNFSALVLEVSALRLDMAWELDGEHFIPNPGSPGSPRMAMRWKVPESMRLKFILCVDQWAPPYLSSAYLVAGHPDHEGIFKVNLPNIYEDGKICLGTLPPYRDVPSLIEVACRQLQAAPWNADLYTERVANACASLFRFLPSGQEFVQVDWPPDFDWTAHSYKISNDFLLQLKSGGLL